MEKKKKDCRGFGVGLFGFLCCFFIFIFFGGESEQDLWSSKHLGSDGDSHRVTTMPTIPH